MIEWKFELEVEQNDLLTEAGRREHQEMGARWRNRLDLVNDMTRTEVRSSFKSRCIDSGASFVAGLFMDQLSLPMIQLDNHLLRFYDECDKFQVEVNDNE